MTTQRAADARLLPPTVRDYLAAHAAGDVTAALRAFAPDAVVTDQGETFRGTDQVRDFLGRAGAEYTWTTELIGVQRVDDTHWVATNRLEGDFPGGVADLGYWFVLAGDAITGLAIVPS
ncbi:MAG: hypothetical protein JWN84_1695 [Nocardioides sp.]|jgi:ketosteroid isomerase-like protein|nr:hypothetical protein [Nocardioides sp.]